MAHIQVFSILRNILKKRRILGVSYRKKSDKNLGKIFESNLNYAEN